MTHPPETCMAMMDRYLRWHRSAWDDGERGAARWFLDEWVRWMIRMKRARGEL